MLLRERRGIACVDELAAGFGTSQLLKLGVRAKTPVVRIIIHELVEGGEVETKLRLTTKMRANFEEFLLPSVIVAQKSSELCKRPHGLAFQKASENHSMGWSAHSRLKKGTPKSGQTKNYVSGQMQIAR